MDPAVRLAAATHFLVSSILPGRACRKNKTRMLVKRTITLPPHGHRARKRVRGE